MATSEPGVLELLAAEAAMLLATLNGEFADCVPGVSVIWFAARHCDCYVLVVV